MSGGVGHLVFTGPVLLAMPIAAAAGAITFLSPCCLPLLPGYLAYVTGVSGDAAVTEPDTSGATVGTGTTMSYVAVRRRALSRVVPGALLFVIGFSALFAVEGVAVSSIGDALASHRAVIARILGGLVIVLGLMFMGTFDRFIFAGRIFRSAYRPRAGLVSAPLLGVLFGLSWTPCTGPTLAAVLALGENSGTALRGGLLAFVYGLGLGVPFVIGAFAFDRGVSGFGFARRHAWQITKIGGLMLITIGVLEVTGAWANVITWITTHWLNGYNPPF